MVRDCSRTICTTLSETTRLAAESRGWLQGASPKYRELPLTSRYITPSPACFIAFSLASRDEEIEIERERERAREGGGRAGIRENAVLVCILI